MSEKPPLLPPKPHAEILGAIKLLSKEGYVIRFGDYVFTPTDDGTYRWVDKTKSE